MSERDASARPDPQPRVIDVLRFASGYWSGPGSRAAWFWTLAVFGMVIATIAVNVGLNRWNGTFYNALEKRDAEALAGAALLLPVLLLGVAGVGVGMVFFRETLQVRWRAWLVGALLRHWMKSGRTTRPQADDDDAATHPEYRIADDSRMLVEPMVDLFIGLTNAVLTAATFIGILYAVGGSLTIQFDDGPMVIPGYMVIVALLYGALISSGMIWIGRPLVGRLSRRSEAEAAFRSAVADHNKRRADPITEPTSATMERLDGKYAVVISRALAVVAKHCHITWITNTNGVFVSILPLIVCIPKYLAGEYTLGDVMRIAPAFVQVQIAIAWLVDNFRIIAQAYASAERIGAIVGDPNKAPPPAAVPTPPAPTAAVPVKVAVRAETV